MLRIKVVVVGKGGRIEGGGWEPKFRVFGRSFAYCGTVWAVW